MSSISIPGSRVALGGLFTERTLDLLDDLTHSTPSATDSHEVEMRVVANPDRWDVVVDGHGMTSCGFPGDIDDAVVRALNQLTLETDPKRLHLHAACVDHQGKGIVLSGKSGSGKTTLTLELLRAGCLYLSDEILTVLPQRRTLFGYPKPLTLKSSIAFAEGSATLPFSSEGRAAIRASQFAEIAPHTQADVVVFPRYSAGHRTKLQRIGGATAAMLLLENSFDAVRIGYGSLAAVARALDGASCWMLEYGEFRDAALTILELQRDLITELSVVHEFQTLDALHPSQEVAVFNDGALLLEHPGGRIVNLSLSEAIGLERRATGSDAADTLDRLSRVGLAIAKPSTPVRRFTPISSGLPNNPTSLSSAPTSDDPTSDDRCQSNEPADIDTLIEETRALLAQLRADSQRALLVWEPNITKGFAGHYPEVEFLLLSDDFSRHLPVLESRGFKPVETVFRHAPKLKTYELRLTDGSRLAVSDALLPEPFSEYLPNSEVVRRAGPASWNEIWCQVLDPIHQFLVACARVALAHDPSSVDLRRVVMTAPRSQLHMLSARYSDSGVLFHAAVRAATHCASAQFGGIPAYFTDSREGPLAVEIAHLQSWIEHGNTAATRELEQAVLAPFLDQEGPK